MGFQRPEFSPLCTLPNKNGKGCLKIVRVENGNLQTMVVKFLQTYGAAIGGKDIILIGSATQLMREGVA
jgi:hypothetical protein